MSSYFNTVLVGFSPMETKKIEQILKLTKSSILSYVPQNESNTNDINIILANAESSDAVKHAEMLLEKSASALLVFVGVNPEQAAERCCIEKPIISIRFLGRLNSLVASHNVPSCNDSLNSGTGLEFVVTSSAVAANRDRYVLVVDDSAIMHKACENELLQISSSIKIAFASSGEEAIEQIKEADLFDLVLLDVMMPGIDGYQTCEIIRKDPRYKNTPIVMLSARTNKLDEMKGIMAGCTAYLAKPIVHDSFQTLLQRMLF